MKHEGPKPDTGQLLELLQLRDCESELVAGEIHDGFIQHAIGAKMWLQSLDSSDSPEEQRQTIQTALNSISTAVDEARAIVTCLCALQDQTETFRQSIERLTEGFRIDDSVQFSVHVDEGLPQLPRVMRQSVLHMIYDLLIAARRRHPTVANLVVQVREGQLWINLQDNGPRMENAEGAEELTGIRRQASVFGGQVSAQRTPSEGTLVSVRLPVLTDQEPSRK